jgi:ATP-binding cassette subfamily B protein
VGISIVLRSSIQFIGALILLAFTNLQLMGLLVVVLPAVIVPILFIGRWVRRLSKDTQDRVADASGHAEEILNAVEIVQAFTAEELESKRFGGAVSTSFHTAIRRIQVRALLTTVATSGVFGALIFVLWVGAQSVLSGDMSAGELGQFVLYAVFVGASAAALSEFWGEVQRASGAMERIAELLQIEPAIQTPENPVMLPANCLGRVQFDNVTFSYPSRPGILALKNFSLDIRAGEHVAFVGPSGAGKSTLFQLLLRFYNTSSGTIMVDGIDIALADPAEVRGRLGIVPQETTIFGASAAENIRFGRPGASLDDIKAAARAASAFEFIEKLPEGFDTFLGQKGARLSGGQRQRIAIARAVLRDPKILLLDEATSSLDAASERLVQHALDKLQKNRTTLVIAHRLATVMQADRIVVMEAGQIQDVGTHQALLGRNAMYARMVELQFGEAA